MRLAGTASHTPQRPRPAFKGSSRTHPGTMGTARPLPSSPICHGHGRGNRPRCRPGPRCLHHRSRGCPRHHRTHRRPDSDRRIPHLGRPCRAYRHPSPARHTAQASPTDLCPRRQTRNLPLPHLEPRSTPPGQHTHHCRRHHRPPTGSSHHTRSNPGTLQPLGPALPDPCQARQPTHPRPRSRPPPGTHRAPIHPEPHLPALPLDPPQPADTHRTEHLQDHPARHLDTVSGPRTSRHWLIAAHTQLRLARPLATELRRPWEKPAPPHKLTPARVRRGFRNLRTKTGSPAGAPKPTVPGPGRPPGSKNRRPTIRHDVGRVLTTGEAYQRPAHHKTSAKPRRTQRQAAL